MALDFQLASVKFTKGLDTRTEHKLVVPGKWSALTNVYLSENGTPRKRDGVAQLATVAGGGLQNGNGLATHNNQLLTINGGAVSSVSTALGQTVPVTGRLGFVGVSKSEVRRSTGMQDSCDVATGGGYTCYVWRELTGGAVVTGVNVAVIDEATGAVLLVNTQMRTSAAVFCPRVIFCPDATGPGGMFFVFYIQAGTLYGREISTATPATLGAEAALVGAVANINFDCARFGTGAGGHATAMVSYATTVGPSSVDTVQVARGNPPVVVAGPTALHTTIQLAVANIVGVACVPYSATLAATFVLGAGANPLSGTSGATINASWAVVTAAALINANPPAVATQCHITGAVVGTLFRVATDDRSAWGSNANNPIDTFLVTSVMVQSGATVVAAYSADFGGAATDPAGPRGPYIAGKAFTSGGTVFLPVEVLENYQSLAATKASDNQQSTVFLMEIGDATATGPVGVVAKALYGAIGVATINNVAPTVSTPCSTPALTAGGFAYATTERTLLSLVGGFNVSPTGVVRLTWTPNTTLPPSRVQLGETTYIAGGVLSAYDGTVLVEHGFNLFPEGINVELVLPLGGGLMTAGAHQVVAIYEWVDGAGQRHQSAPSMPVTVTTALNDRLRVRVPTLHLTQKTGVTIAAYITQAGGLTFNRVATTALGAAGTDNDATVAFVTLPLIDAADTAYDANELLYTQPLQAGTTLPNYAPPPCNMLAVHQNRLWLDAADAPGQFVFSQTYVNNLGLQFNVNLVGRVDVSGGSLVGLCPLDEKLVLFCQRKPYVIYGTGPNAAGSFSNYVEPQEIPSDVGCGERRSILRMPTGIIFKSVGNGWHLLGRDLAVRYIGDGVASFDGNNVTSAVLLEDRQECRFTSTTATGGTSPILVYSYLPGDGQWSTFNPYSTTLTQSYLPADALWWPQLGAYVHISTAAGINRDTVGVYSDAPGGATGRVITMTLTTSFLHLGEIGGFQRVRWLHLTMTAVDGSVPTSSLGIFVLFDDLTTTGQGRNYSFPEPLATALAGQPRPQQVLDLRHKLQVQKCKSVAFSFIETPAAVDAPQLLGLQALTLEVGLRKGVNRLSAAQTVG